MDKINFKYFKKILKRVFKSIFEVKKYRCAVCGSRVKDFLALEKVYELNAKKFGYPYFGLNEHLNIQKYTCPKCKASDRDRLYALYFRKKIKNQSSKKKLLHVAPAWSLNNLFLSPLFEITTTDLLMENVDIKMDIENMAPINDNTFDHFICSHVLEHVENPDKALKELFRVLKPDGEGILMVPLIPILNETLEDPSHQTEEERIRNYGQADHLRLFSKTDYEKRIAEAGFSLSKFGIEYFGEKSFSQNGIKDTSILYVGKKVLS